MVAFIAASGRGYLVAIVTFLSLLASEFITESVTQDDRYYQTHGWPKTVGFSAAALLTGMIVRWTQSSARRLLDPETGEEVLVHGNDSLFFIPMRHWTWLLVILGGVFWFVREP